MKDAPSLRRHATVKKNIKSPIIIDYKRFDTNQLIKLAKSDLPVHLTNKRRIRKTLKSRLHRYPNRAKVNTSCKKKLKAIREYFAENP
jgi:hypothetical protein